MSPIRTSAYGEITFMNDMGTMGSYTPMAQRNSSNSFDPVTRTANASEQLCTPRASRKRRSPNAFILFRSYLIANKRVPPEIVHQNDVSRYVAEVWKSKLTPSERAVFFKMAEEEKIRFEIEGPREPAKKRRSRSKKMSQSCSPESTADPCLPSSLSSASEVSFAEHGTSSSFLDGSPHTYPSREIYPTSTDGDQSVSLSAPQPTHAIPPCLLNWGDPAEHQVLSPEEQAFTTFQHFTPTTNFSATCVGSESHVPFMDLDFNALRLDGLLLGMDMAFTNFAGPDFSFPALFETPF